MEVIEVSVVLARVFIPFIKNAWAHYREIHIKGGRGGGKTHNMAKGLGLKFLEEPDANILVLREYGTNIKDSIKAEFDDFFMRNNLDFISMESGQIEVKGKNRLIKINTESIINNQFHTRIIFAGINKRTIMGLKSLKDIKYCLIDEADFLTEELYRILKPTIRGKNSQIIAMWNPKKEDDYIEQLSRIPNPRRLVLKVNYRDNEFFPDVMEADRQDDEATLPRQKYLHIWEGETLNYNEMQVIDTTRLGRFNSADQCKYSEIVLSVDTASTIKRSSDYTAFGVFGKVQETNRIHLIYLIRGKWLYSELEDKFFSCLEITKRLTGGQSVKKVLIENKQTGSALIQDLQRKISLPIVEVNPTKDKLTRVLDTIDLYAHLLDLPVDLSNPYNCWVEDYLKELEAFRADDKHEHDDQVDVTSQAIAELCKRKMDMDQLDKLLDFA